MKSVGICWQGAIKYEHERRQASGFQTKCPVFKGFVQCPVGGTDRMSNICLEVIDTTVSSKVIVNRF